MPDPTFAVDVCVCTRNPRRDVLRITLNALARQTFDKARFSVLIVDNASTPPLGSVECEPLADQGIHHRIVREPRLGVSFARLRAIEESNAPLIIFVDDDNELFDDYIATAVRIFEEEPTLGCAGPKLFPGPAVQLPHWLEPIRNYIAIRDTLGDDPITEEVTELAFPAAPNPGAGMVVRRQVADLYREFKSDLGSLRGYCEDLLLTLQVRRVGMLCGYRPQLGLRHHLDPRRFKFSTMSRMFIREGQSEVAMFRFLGRGRPWSAADLVRCHF
jgi:glycosyltransferase involved in cell wall biosynthesis